MKNYIRIGLLALYMLGALPVASCSANNSSDSSLQSRSAAKDSDQYAGSYDLGSNGFIAIGPLEEADGHLMFTDYKTGRAGFLLPAADGTFYSGPSFRKESPIDIKVAFTKNEKGDVTGLVWNQRGAPEMKATKTPFRREEVRFQNGAVTLSGTLFLPATKGPHPGLVLIHGSGAATRSMGATPYLYLHFGVAVLTYDKRGTGASSGELTRASIDDLAGDALAAVGYLKNHADINPRQIGVRGDSQGGWVAPLAASRSKDIAFLIVRSASARTQQDNLVYEVENEVRSQGFSEEDARQAGKIRQLLSNALATNTGWDSLTEALEKARSKPWLHLTQATWVLSRGVPTGSYLRDLQRVFIFDPIPVWEQITCPVLVLLGEVDRSVPTQESAPKIEQALRKAGNKDFTITVFPKGSHGLLESETGYNSDAPNVKRYVPGYLESMTAWLLKRVEVKSPPPKSD